MPRRLAFAGHSRTLVVPGCRVTRDKTGARKRRRGAVSRVSRVSRADFVKVGVSAGNRRRNGRRVDVGVHRNLYVSTRDTRDTRDIQAGRSLPCPGFVPGKCRARDNSHPSLSDTVRRPA